ncbi:MAG: peptidoglycan DD-metalloendopeptidase family protein [Desulfobacterales bacterium]|nr:peptidoglycan DD-metalloendopeptidase family protein [Desulfobacterales bacterium]
MLSVPETNTSVNPLRFAAILAACLGLFALFVGSAWGAEVLFKGTTSAFKLNVRSAPSQKGRVVMTLDKGDEVDVLKVDGGIGGWLTIRYKGKTGYVRNRTKYMVLSRVETVSAKAEVKPKPKSKPKVEEPQKIPEKKKVRVAEKQQKPPEKKAIAKKIEAETRKVDSFSRKEMEILDGLNEIDYSLSQARTRAKALRREKDVLVFEIKRIQEKTDILSRSMETNKDYAARRLNALYRMHMMGSLEMAGPPASLFDFFVKQRALKKVVASDFDLIAKQAGDLSDLNQLEADLEAQQSAKNLLEEELSTQILIKEKESGKKAVILKEIRRQKKLSEAALASLKSSAEELDNTLNTMGLKGRADLDDTSFVKQKGRLPLPAGSKIISRYGTSRSGDYKSFTFKSGIDIRVERGEPVRSVFKGEVMFAQWLKGYGNLLIINHGDNYYTLYAHVEEMFKKKGDTVGTGEVIATAGDSGSIKGLCLHFEVRHHGKPVNPMTWLNIGA